MFYLDIGAFHPIIYSNTHKLHKMGWYGVCMDFSQETEVAFKNIRSRAQFFRIPLGGETCSATAAIAKKV